MSNYILLLRGGIRNFGQLPSEKQSEIIERYRTWANQLREKQTLVDAAQLDDDGRMIVKKENAIQVDGPFTETHETIGGYYLIRADDFASATEITRGCPIFLEGGTVEIRQIQS